MLISNRSIPKVGSALLLLGGCGHAADVESLSEEYCREFQRCAPESFAESYGTRKVCEADFSGELNYTLNTLERDVGDQCADALITYYDCVFGTITGCYADDPYSEFPFLYDDLAAQHCEDALYSVCPEGIWD